MLSVEILWANFPSEALDIHLSYMAPSPAQTLPLAMAEEMATACVLWLDFCLFSVKRVILLHVVISLDQYS